MEREKITYDALPDAIAYLIDEIADVKRLLLHPERNFNSRERKLVDIDDACRIIMKSKSTIYFLVQKRLLPCYKIGKKLHFYEDELLEWIKSCRKTTVVDMKAELALEMQSGIKNRPKRRF